MAKISIIITAFLLLLITGFVYSRYSDSNEAIPGINIETPSSEETLTPSKETSENTPSKETPAQKDLPREYFLEVPFTPQAPTANWDELHNEACEEASLLMANAHFNGDTRSTMPASEAEREIEKLTKWQQEKLGYYLSIDSAELARMATEVYGLKAEVIRENITEETIKRALSENKLVLVPVNGRQLGNPYFQTPGPIYHMFVIKGYDKKSFITNEPGTKRGQDYRYSYDTIRKALGDYDHEKKETDPSKPAIILISK